ncbi:MAG TPA: hypothetical protein HPP94_13150 [Desulfuromonadales bacterium]|nr:hypothetical protein [Desulfuromonadales bacterium]
MPVSGISTSSAAAKYAPAPPQQQALAQTPQKKRTTDTVSISQQAALKAQQAQQSQQAPQLSTYGNATTQGTMNSSTGNASAKLTGKA